MRICLFIISFFVLQLGRAQQLTLKLLDDSLFVGDRFKVALVFQHSSSEEVFFPKDQKYFKPYDYKGIETFPTYTTAEISTDCVVYQLQTFEIDTKRKLRLPVFIYRNSDSTTLWSNEIKMPMITLVSDAELRNSSLKSDLALHQELETFNWRLVAYILAITAFLGLMWLLLQDQILRQIKLFKLWRKQKDFQEAFIEIMKGDFSFDNITEANMLWRSHLQSLQRRPFPTMTAVEIQKATGDENVGDAIKELESILFGGRESGQLSLALQVLLKYAKQQYKIRKNRIKNLKKIKR